MSKERKCEGLTALVTGASSGIGLEYSHQLAEMGASVILVSNQREALNSLHEELTKKYPSQFFGICFKDLCDDDCADFLLDYCRKNTVGIDILINNAGIFSFREVCDMSQEQLNVFINLHIKAVTMISRVFADDMKKRNFGYILNMSSMSCRMPMPGIAMYSATKAYIQVFSRALYLEMKDSGVAVMTACPGGIATDLFGLPKNLQQFAVKIGVLATPQNFVRGALKRLFKKKQQYVNGLLNKIAMFAVPKLPVCVKMLVKHKLLDNRK